MVKVITAQAMEKGRVFLFDSKDMEMYFYKEQKNISYITEQDGIESFISEVTSISGANKEAFAEAVKGGKNITPRAFYETVEPAYIIIDDLDDFTTQYQSALGDLAAVMKTAAESGIGVIATLHSSKAKGYDELNKWFKTSSNGLVVGNMGTTNIYPAVSMREMPALGDGLFYTNSAYERLLLPRYVQTE